MLNCKVYCTSCLQFIVIVGKILKSTKIGNLYKHSVEGSTYFKYNNVYNSIYVPQQRCEHISQEYGVNRTSNFFEAWGSLPLRVGSTHFLAGNSRNQAQEPLSLTITCVNVNVSYKSEWKRYFNILHMNQCCQYAGKR